MFTHSDVKATTDPDISDSPIVSSQFPKLHYVDEVCFWFINSNIIMYHQFM